MKLAGNAPFIVVENFDPKVAAKLAMQGHMINTHQACYGANRFIVVEKIANGLLAELLQLTLEYMPGDAMDEATTLGPASSKLALDRQIYQLGIIVPHSAMRNM